jgi:hypothetical protein
MRNQTSAATPVNRNPHTNEGCRSKFSKAPTEGANPACAIPVFIRTLATAIQAAVKSTNKNPTKVTLFRLREQE